MSECFKQKSSFEDWYHTFKGILTSSSLIKIRPSPPWPALTSCFFQHLQLFSGWHRATNFTQVHFLGRLWTLIKGSVLHLDSTCFCNSRALRANKESRASALRFVCFWNPECCSVIISVVTTQEASCLDSLYSEEMVMGLCSSSNPQC